MNSVKIVSVSSIEMAIENRINEIDKRFKELRCLGLPINESIEFLRLRKEKERLIEELSKQKYLMNFVKQYI